MKVLLAQNLLHLPAHGGASRSNRLLMEQLAAAGHECHIVAPMGGAAGGHTPVTLVTRLATERIRPVVHDDGVSYESAGVRVHAVARPNRLVGQVRAVARRLRPEVVLVPSDDPGALMLAVALGVAPDRVVYLVHTLQQLPFGPRTFARSEAATALVRRTAGRVAVSRAAQAYLRRWAGLDSYLLHPPVYGEPPFPHRQPDAPGAVTLVNPCGYKGIAIFLGLADAFPHVPFLAVPTWGTTSEDRAALARRTNIEVVEATDHIDEFLRRTRVLLMPSLWDETFGYTAVEAMLRAIPVLASDVAGLTEAKLGVPYLLPVRPIEAYRHADRARPEPVVPTQELAPWQRVLARLFNDDSHYRELAGQSRAAAERFVTALDPKALERYLASVVGAGHHHREPA